MSKYIDKYGKHLLNIKESQLIQSLHLSSIINIQNWMPLSAQEISIKWNDHFDKKPFHVSLAISKRHFEKWMERAAIYPNFIIPLTKEKRVENFLVQHGQIRNGHCQVGFARLADYQQFDVNSPSAVTVNAYSNFAASHQVVLINGHFNEAHLNRKQSKVMIVGASEIYCHLFDWVKQFNEQPTVFDYQAYLLAFNQLISAIK